ncbi:uncharacterized protein LOC143363191 [Halictus rubicundus]|uniref:uncharacterized protein LOC143363191 n=1 Tax=Halictus rubicundus TaxID=77578 RepID=UPI0040356415
MELSIADYDHRVRFCEWLQGVVKNDFLCKILFSDEATFMNSGHVNRHNLHYWAVENPNWMRCVPFQHRWSLNVWCGLIGDFVIGPYFFQETVTSASYCDFLKNHLPALLEDVPLHVRREMWFQQDGAPPHFAIITRQFLNEKFGNKWIGRGGPRQWTPRSPDLTPLDFFLWGYVKDKVMFEPPTTKEDMKQRIRDACASVTPEMLKNVRTTLMFRVSDKTASVPLKLERNLQQSSTKDRTALWQDFSEKIVANALTGTNEKDPEPGPSKPEAPTRDQGDPEDNRFEVPPTPRPATPMDPCGSGSRRPGMSLDIPGRRNAIVREIGR